MDKRRPDLKLPMESRSKLLHEVHRRFTRDTERMVRLESAHKEVNETNQKRKQLARKDNKRVGKPVKMRGFRLW